MKAIRLAAAAAALCILGSVPAGAQARFDGA